MSSAVIFPWVRFWTKRGETPTRSGGYLAPRADDKRWSSQSATLQTLAELEQVPCLILLGDPGSGKSVEIGSEAERLRTRGGVTLMVDLKRRDAALIDNEVFSSPEFLGWIEGRHDLTILLDSMDECWRRVTTLGPFLANRLQRHVTAENRSSLRLRLSCRGAEWQDEVETEFRKIFAERKDENFVQVWHLAPLTRDDIRSAAENSSLNAERFLNEVEQRDVNALAALPITLRMLLDTAIEGGALGRNRAEIYSAAMARLCEDSHQQTQATPRLRSTVLERLAAATHVAACGVFTNRYLIFGSFERRPDKDDGILSAIDLMNEPLVRRNDPLSLTRELLLDTLQSGLFESQPNSRFTWRHQSFVEYLAAHYLAERELSVRQLISLLCDKTGPEPRIWPQLEETTCWLAGLKSDLFDALVASNGEVLVRCDPARLSPDQRSRIVAGYFEDVRRHQARMPFFHETENFYRLEHPGLAAQVLAVLDSPTDTWLVQDLALDIAKACNTRVLVPRLIELMFDRAAVQRLRHAAAYILRGWADDAIRQEVKARLNPEVIEDENDDVRGCVLSILWPSHLSVTELIPLMKPPKRDNYGGSYMGFLSADFLGRTSPADLPALLRWVSGIESDSDYVDSDPYFGVCAKVAFAAFAHLRDPAVRTEFFALVRSLSRRDGRLFSTEHRDLAGETVHRRIFWEEFMASDEPVRNRIVQSSLDESGFIVREDFAWITSQAAAAKTAELRNRWLELAFWQFSPETNLTHLELMWKFAEADPEVRKGMMRYISDPLVEDNEQNWKKERYYRELKQNEEKAKRKPFSVQVDEVLSLYQQEGKLNYLWGLDKYLNQVVRLDDEGPRNNAEIGWNRLSESQHQTLVAIAPKFLAGTAVKLDEVYEPQQIYHNYSFGIRLLLSLFRARSPWLQQQGQHFWLGWTHVLFAYQERTYRSDSEPWADLAALIHRQAPSSFLDALGRWFDVPADRHRSISILEKNQTDATVDAIVLKAAESRRDFDLFAFLLQRSSSTAEVLLRSWQPEKDIRGSFADAVLACYCPSARPEIVTGILSDPARGKAIMVELHAGGSLRSGWIAQLPAESITRLWEWLDKQYPGDPYEEQRGAGFVTLDHEVFHLRSGLLSVLEARGDDEAVEALGALVRRRPEIVWLGQILSKARHACRRKDWNPPLVSDLQRYFRSLDQNPLCADGDLCDAVLASLGRYQSKLRGLNPTTELWDTPAGPVKLWCPKDENNLSNCLARHLNSDLGRFGVMALRETEIRARTGDAQGDLPDILVQAISSDGKNTTLTVVVEVKGAWHADVVGSMSTQLHDRYLRSARCGIHVTGYFTSPGWRDDDSRKTDGLCGKSYEEVVSLLTTEQAKLQATTTKRVEVMVLDARM